MPPSPSCMFPRTDTSHWRKQSASLAPSCGRELAMAGTSVNKLRPQTIQNIALNTQDPYGPCSPQRQLLIGTELRQRRTSSSSSSSSSSCFRVFSRVVVLFVLVVLVLFVFVLLLPVLLFKRNNNLLLTWYMTYAWPVMTYA